MKNIILLVLVLALISIGIFLGIGIRTQPNIVVTPIELSMTEKSS